MKKLALPTVALLLCLAGLFVYRSTRAGKPSAGVASTSPSSHTTRQADPRPAGAPGTATAKPPTETLKGIMRPRLDAEGRKHLYEGPGEALEAEFDSDLLVAWAAKDPEAALKWITAAERDVSFGDLLGAVAAGILIKDGRDAMSRFLKEHEHDEALSPKEQSELEKRSFYHLGREDTIDAAMDMLTKSQDASPAGALIAGMKGSEDKLKAIDRLEGAGLPVQIDYWILQDAAAEAPALWSEWALKRQSDMLEDVVTAWHRQSPEEAKRWVETKVPKNDPRRAGLDELFQIREAPLPPDEAPEE